MKYEEKEKEKSITIRDKIFRDSGQGVFFGKKGKFVLSEPHLNLWEGIREDAMDYFFKNRIPWESSQDEPTRPVLSSQIA